MEQKTNNLSFYSSLVNYMKTKVENEKILEPKNPEIIVKDLETLSKNNNSDYNITRGTIVSIYIILTNIYKDLLKNRKRKATDVTVTSATPSSTTNVVRYNRYDIIPSYIQKCESRAIKVGVTLFIANNFNEKLKKNLLFSILNGNQDTTTIESLCELMKKSPGAIRNFIEQLDSSTTPDHEKCLVRASIELSELLRDRALSKLALDINATCYFDTIQKYVNNDLISSYQACDALVQRYLKKCVPFIKLDEEKSKIRNELKVNLQSTILYMLKALTETSKPQRNAESKEQNYEIFKGPLNYFKDITTTYIEHNNNLYLVHTFNDCLYDVLGRYIKLPDGGYSSEMYLHLLWSDRLAQLPYRTKIALTNVTSDELEELNGNMSVACSWVDENGFACSRIQNFQKRYDKKTKN